MTTYIIDYEPVVGRTPWQVYTSMYQERRRKDCWLAGFATREQCTAFVQGKHVNAWTELDRRQDCYGRGV